MTKIFHSDIKKEFPTLEDLMYNNKAANKRHKRKKNYKKFKDYLESRKQDADQDLY